MWGGQSHHIFFCYSVPDTAVTSGTDVFLKNKECVETLLNMAHTHTLLLPPEIPLKLKRQ